MARCIYFEEIALEVPHETFARTITEADIVFHAGHTGDFFPHHVDAEFAKQTAYGQRIAHGTMTFAIAIGLKALHINEVSLSYGYDRVRFIKPVFIGDTIRTRSWVIRKEDDPKRPTHGRVFEKVEVVNQRGEVVMACEEISLVKKRAPGAA
jgi:acyl dehydratase